MDLVIEYKLFVGKFMWIHKVGGPMLPKRDRLGSYTLNFYLGFATGEVNLSPKRYNSQFTDSKGTIDVYLDKDREIK